MRPDKYGVREKAKNLHQNHKPEIDTSQVDFHFEENNLKNPSKLNPNFYKFMQWDITSRCNLNCAHCRSTEFYLNSHIKDLTLKQNQSIAEKLYVNGIRRIHFLGGEPLIREDFCDFVKYIHKLGITWSVNTNGTLITNKIAEDLLSCDPQVITVSLDGPDKNSNDLVRGNGVFDKVCKNIARLVKIRNQMNKKTRIVISATLVQQSINRVDQMVKLSNELGVNSLILSSLRMMGRAKGSANKLAINSNIKIMAAQKIAKKAKINDQHVQLGFLTPIEIEDLNEELGTDFPIYDSSCGALIDKGFIQPDGSLFPCQSLTDTADLPKVLGTMTRKSLINYEFNEIWDSPAMHRIKDLLFHPSIDQITLPCQFCKYYKVICYPCPITALRGSWSIFNDCMQAMDRMAARRGHPSLIRDLLKNALPNKKKKGRRKNNEITRLANS